MHTIKITPNLLFEYQCTSGKFIRLPNRIEKIHSVARIESNQNFFCPNSNALLVAMQQLIDISWPTAANPLQWRAVANGMYRQTDAQQLHRSCSTYYAGSAK